MHEIALHWDHCNFVSIPLVGWIFLISLFFFVSAIKTYSLGLPLKWKFSSRVKISSTQVHRTCCGRAYVNNSDQQDGAPFRAQRLVQS